MISNTSRDFRKPTAEIKPTGTYNTPRQAIKQPTPSNMSETRVAVATSGSRNYRRTTNSPTAVYLPALINSLYINTGPRHPDSGISPVTPYRLVSIYFQQSDTRSRDDPEQNFNHMKLDHMRLDHMRLDHMRLDHMRLDHMRLDHIRLDQL
ncbi:hypothetical protein J6590_074756 [Homalodisca vitripennis]|nr:hypothetical protein J6590_074756 [Homalodisca vitripennis]